MAFLLDVTHEPVMKKANEHTSTLASTSTHSTFINNLKTVNQSIRN